MGDVFATHREYWEELCTHAEPVAERAYLQAFVNSQKNSSLQFTSSEILSVCKGVRVKSAPGLDCWSNQHLACMNKECATALSSVFEHILASGEWPSALLKARVSLLPKPNAPAEKVSSWRPITITSVFYRLYAKACLFRCIQSALQYLPSEMLGGIPNRHSQVAVVRVYFWIERLVCTGQGSLYGVSLDAAKCFDRIALSDALKAGMSCAIPLELLAPVISFYLGHERHTSVRHFLDRRGWEVSRGLIQGCSISVLLTCCVLRSWHEAMGPNVSAFSYIDDRLLLSSESAQLEASWHHSERWDIERHWMLNQKKTIQFCVGGRMETLTWAQEPLTVQSQFVWLGHEYFTRYNSSRTVWPKRLEAAQEAIRKLATLKTTPVTKQKVVERAIAPIFSYGVHATMPPLSQIKGLTQRIRQALWGKDSKRFHCFPLACAVLYRVHCLDVRSALIYNHVLSMCTALCDSENWRLYQELKGGPRFQKPRGPAHLLDSLLAEIGGAILPGQYLDLGTSGHVSFRDRKLLGHRLRDVLRHALVAKAAAKRRNLNLGGANVDFQTTTLLYRKQYVKHRSGLVTLLLDGAITQERLVHMSDEGTEVTDQCSFCGREREDIHHVLWVCKHWERFRTLASGELLLLQGLPPAAVSCGLALDSFTDRQKKIWPKVQEQCALVLEQHQQALCHPRNREAKVSVLRNPRPCEPGNIPEAATFEQWAAGNYLELRSVTNLSSSHVPWMFSRQQYNQLTHWLASVRIARDPETVPKVCILEVYVSYILANEGHRFTSGLSEKSRGHWWTVQVSQFMRAIRSIQGLALDHKLLPDVDAGAAKADWARRWHVPPQILMVREGLVLPQHARVREFLDNWCLMPTGASHDASSGAELWRRQTIGNEHSQVVGGGALSQLSINWQWSSSLVRRRWSKKITPAPWMLSYYNNKSWVRDMHQLADRNNFALLLGIAGLEGVECSRDLAIVAGKRTKKAKLYQSIVQQNEAAVSLSSHVGAYSGARIQCALCEMCAPLSHTRVWCKKSCSSDVGGRGGIIRRVNAELGAVIAQMEREAAELRLAARAL